jgi:DNA mismatch endonuclease (patch repair protein)
MQGNRRADTRPELALRSALHRRGLRYRLHDAPEADLRCRADVVLRSSRVAVFVDGCFWHGCPEHGTKPTTNSAYWNPKIERNVLRDLRNSSALEARGWTVIRVWEHEDPELAAGRIIEAVASRRGAAKDQPSTAARPD